MTPKRPALGVVDITDDLRKQLEKKLGRSVRTPRRQWPMDDVRRHAISCLAVLAHLTPGQRRRVLKHAAKLNDL